jgi:outer membrane protein|tara:strand:- start:20711 stop:22126 length:1416 start_codon:yes stop_codon:yes gene_type:complete
MHRAFLIILLFSAFHISAQSTEKWDLRKCIDYALENNVSIQQNRLQGEILTNNLKQAQLSRIPSLNGSGSHAYNIGRAIDPFTNTFNNATIQNNSFSLSSGVILYGGSQINNTIKQNKLGTRVNDENTKVIRNQIALSVASTYLQIVQAEENLKVAESQKQITKSQLDRATKLVASGSTNRSTQLSLQAQLANDQVNIINTQNAIQIGYNTLMNLMQYPIDEVLEIEQVDIINLPESILESVADIYQQALSNLPEIRQAELQIEQGKIGEKVAGAGLQPTLSAFGNINTVYSQSGKLVTTTDDIEIFPIGFTQNSLEPVLSARNVTTVNDKAFSNQLSDNLGQQVGLSLSVPIFNGYRSRTAVQNAQVNSKINKLNLDNTKNQLRNDVTTAYTNLKAAKSRFDAAAISEEAQRLNFEFAQKRFEAGASINVDLLTAKNQWSQAQTQLLNAKYEFVFRTLIINFYKGQELKL